FDALHDGYAWSLRWVLRYRIVMLAVFVAVILATLHMFNIVPKGFIPDQDNDSLFVNLRAAQGTSYYDMARWTEDVAKLVIQNPYVESFIAGAGGGNGQGGGGGSANNSRLMVQLTPRATRPVSAAQIAQRMIRPQLLRFPGFRAFVNVPSAIQIGGRMGNQNYSIMLQSLNTDELYEWAPKLEQAIAAQVPEVQDPSTDLEMKSPRINMVMDRDKAVAVGLNATQIQNALYDALG